MKKLFFILLCALIQIPRAVACDVCGCSIGNGFSTILPQFNKNFTGIRGSYARFESHHVGDLQINQETSAAAELWGRFYVGKRLQILPVIPFAYKSRTEHHNTTRIQGLGDASVSINYTLINRGADSLKWKHLLLAGGGIKVPTGQYKNNSDELSQVIALQPGTGSLDYLFNIIYTLRHQQLGFSNDFQARFTGENPERYAFGNKFSFATRGFYWKNIRNKYNLLPSLGILLEHYDKDTKNRYIQSETGGQMASLSAGCEVYYKNFLLAFSYIQPFVQNLSNGNVKALPKLQINTCLLF